MKTYNVYSEHGQEGLGAFADDRGTITDIFYKANTWLKWHGLDSTVIGCITDASKHKQGKFTPLTRIPVVGDEEFARHPQPYALILSWNIGEGLRRAILNINPNTRFISQ